MLRMFCFMALALSLSACSVFAPVPTATPIPTDTPVPTATATVIPTDTPTLEPTATATLEPTATTDVIDALIPEGTPAKEWKGVPIMPGAIAGNGDDKGYTFTIKATAQEVQEFYEAELKKLKYTLLAHSENPVFLIFMKENEVFSVSIIPDKDQLIVLLVK